MNAFHVVFIHSNSKHQDFQQAVSLNKSQTSYILTLARNYVRRKDVVKRTGETLQVMK